MAGNKNSGRNHKPPAHFEQCRQKIQATQIIKALADHVVGKNKMSPSQVTAGLGLLKKVVPDLQQLNLGNANGDAFTLIIKN